LSEFDKSPLLGYTLNCTFPNKNALGGDCGTDRGPLSTPARAARRSPIAYHRRRLPSTPGGAAFVLHPYHSSPERSDVGFCRYPRCGVGTGPERHLPYLALLFATVTCPSHPTEPRTIGWILKSRSPLRRAPPANTGAGGESAGPHSPVDRTNGPSSPGIPKSFRKFGTTLWYTMYRFLLPQPSGRPG
jgi:hypothetical protein